MILFILCGRFLLSRSPKLLDRDTGARSPTLRLAERTTVSLLQARVFVIWKL
jgi:hypothetical protein